MQEKAGQTADEKNRTKKTKGTLLIVTSEVTQQLQQVDTNLLKPMDALPKWGFLLMK